MAEEELRQRSQLNPDKRTQNDRPSTESRKQQKMEEEKSRTSKDSENEVTLFGITFNKVIAATHFNIFLYATCFWIQTGVLPYLTSKLGVDAVVFGYLQTTFALVQLAGGPLFGRFGDLFGGRAAMMLAFSASSLTYFLLGIADNFPMLFMSRLPSIFMHAMQGGQMIVTDIGEESKRADSLGKLGLSYGVGMVVGPLVGGLVTKYFSEQTAAFVACLGSVASIGIVWMFTPHKTKKTTSTAPAEGKGVFDLKKILSLVFAPGALFLLSIRAAAGVPIGVFQSMFSVVALETLKLPAEQNGYLLSYIGILTMLVQGFGVGVFLKKFSEKSMLKWSSFSLIFSYLLLAFVTDVTQLCLVLFPLVVGLASSNIVISSALTKSVPDTDTGAMLGLNMAVNSLIRSVSPTIGGYLLKNFGFSSFGYLGSVVLAITTLVIFIKMRD